LQEKEEIVTYVAEQAQPSSMLGEAPWTLEKYKYDQYGKSSEGDRNAEAFWPGGCSIDFPSKGTFSILYWNGKNIVRCKPHRALSCPLE
jgi:hypothetical protein